jgi:hypothetical protein
MFSMETSHNYDLGVGFVNKLVLGQCFRRLCLESDIIGTLSTLLLRRIEKKPGNSIGDFNDQERDSGAGIENR